MKEFYEIRTTIQKFFNLKIFSNRNNKTEIPFSSKYDKSQANEENQK